MTLVIQGPGVHIFPDGTLGLSEHLYGHSDDAAGRIIHVTLADPVMRMGLSLG